MACRCVSAGGRGRGGSDEFIHRAGGGGGRWGGFCRDLEKVEILSTTLIVIPLRSFLVSSVLHVTRPFQGPPTHISCPNKDTLVQAYESKTVYAMNRAIGLNLCIAIWVSRELPP